MELCSPSLELCECNQIFTFSLFCSLSFMHAGMSLAYSCPLIHLGSSEVHFWQLSIWSKYEYPSTTFLRTTCGSVDEFCSRRGLRSQLACCQPSIWAFCCLCSYTGGKVVWGFQFFLVQFNALETGATETHGSHTYAKDVFLCGALWFA